MSFAAGLTASHVGKIEAGTQCSLTVFARLAKALEMTEKEVLFILANEAENHES